MTPTTTALRSGLRRGVIEFRQDFTGAALIGQLFWPVLTLASLFLLRDRTVGDGSVSLGTMVYPGLIGMFVFFGMVALTQRLSADREDGTLLRAKATPGGIRAYLVGRFVTTALTVVAYLVIVGVPGALTVTGLALLTPDRLLTLAWVLTLGIVATLTLGAVLGSLIPSARASSYIALLVMGLVAISGIFYPITALPGWLQGIAQALPVYWLGLGTRAALLPESAAVLEIVGSWRTGETAIVLAAWSVVATLLAPALLRTMTRKESGSRVAERRDKALQRLG
ncbi:ABC transporter permease [Desertihabitans brevis]|uniref:Transport permease protein n=1 Tax=Desertihabitans brevis TaxID=2268447 RepID=A0A367YWX2_9ACTN|nr:ABC transporter permease [Desertihabitans brevis]RCK70237.1 ABC transporter permease [Desertihabitans brevis]